ncbi:leucine-rich repeat domain-containing protein [bacterium]|nr:leucine-rich repeat domain-containing protein [bacterium]
MQKFFFTIFALFIIVSCDGLNPSGDDNLPPMLTEIEDKRVNEGSELAFQLEASDFDGDNLSFEGENLPEGSSLEDTLFFWTPDFNQAGVYENVIFRVWDDGDPRLSDEDTIKITVVNLNRTPAEATNPFPVDSSEIDDFGITLSWDCSDPDEDSLTYDVYLSDSPYLNVISSNQRDKFYKPDTLKSNRTYYWKIACKDGDAREVVGPVWCFRTPNLIPAVPSNLGPEDECIVDAMDATLLWSSFDPDGDTLTYDLYFGDSSPPQQISTAQEDTSYYTDILELDKTYYWKVTVDDGHGHSVTSPIWSFTTAEDVRIIFPDRYLERMVRLRLDKLSGPLYVSDLAAMEVFDAQQAGITNLSGMQFMTGLTRLNLTLNQISNLSPLSRLTQLKILELDSIGVTDISPLSELTQLDTLLLDLNEIRNIDALTNLTNLKKLWLQGNSIRDLEPLSELEDLVNLNLIGNRISDLSSLAQLVNLKELGLSDNLISDLTALSELKKLTHLFMYSNQIRDISPLASLTGITNLGLSINLISDLSPLSGMHNLVSLSLVENRIQDISPLAGLTNLYWLFLTDNQIRDISALSNLTSLTNIYLDHNQITDAAPVCNLPNLTYLNLDDNYVTDLTPLEELTSIHELHLDRNGIEEVYPLVENPGLSTGDILYIRWNDIGREAISHLRQLEARGVFVYR